MNDRQENGIEKAEDTLVDNGQDAIRIRTPALSSEDARQTYKVVETSLRELWEVVDNLSAILPPRPTYYRVTIFGSSRIRPGDQLYEDVKRLSAELAAMGCDIVTGGGPGLMQAARCSLSGALQFSDFHTHLQRLTGFEVVIPFAGAFRQQQDDR